MSHRRRDLDPGPCWTESGLDQAHVVDEAIGVWLGRHRREAERLNTPAACGVGDVDAATKLAYPACAQVLGDQLKGAAPAAARTPGRINYECCASCSVRIDLYIDEADNPLTFEDEPCDPRFGPFRRPTN